MTEGTKTYLRCLAAYLTGWTIAQNVWNRWWKYAVTGKEVARLQTEHAHEVAEEVMRKLRVENQPHNIMFVIGRLLRDDNVGIKLENIDGTSGYRAEVIYTGRRFPGHGISEAGAVHKAFMNCYDAMIGATALPTTSPAYEDAQ